jgi:hypothetical protein
MDNFHRRIPKYFFPAIWENQHYEYHKSFCVSSFEICTNFENLNKNK